MRESKGKNKQANKLFHILHFGSSEKVTKTFEASGTKVVCITKEYRESTEESS